MNFNQQAGRRIREKLETIPIFWLKSWFFKDIADGKHDQKLQAKRTWMSTFLNDGITYAGFLLLRRPIVPIANSRISNTSSCRAMNNADRFSAWAKWGSNFSSRDIRTEYLMSTSVSNIKSKNISFAEKLFVIGVNIQNTHRTYLSSVIYSGRCGSVLTQVSDAHDQQFAQHISHSVHCCHADITMLTCKELKLESASGILVRVLCGKCTETLKNEGTKLTWGWCGTYLQWRSEQLGTRDDSLSPHFFVFARQEMFRTMLDELRQRVTWEHFTNTTLSSWYEAASVCP